MKLRDLSLTVTALMIGVTACTPVLPPSPIPLAPTDSLRVFVHFPIERVAQGYQIKQTLPDISRIKYLRLSVIGYKIPETLMNKEGFVPVTQSPQGLVLNIPGVIKGVNRIVTALPYDANQNLIPDAILKGYYSSVPNQNQVRVYLKYRYLPVAKIMEELMTLAPDLLGTFNPTALQQLMDQIIYGSNPVDGPTYLTLPTLINPTPIANTIANAPQTLPPPEKLQVPLVDSISPLSSSNVLTTTITIKGKFFQNGLNVQVGNIAATDVTVVDSQTITAKVPAGLASGVYNLKVSNPNGQGLLKTDSFTAARGIITIAGTGNEGIAGDNGPATSSDLEYPYNVYLDAQQNIIVSECGSRIRKILPDGTISTIVGNGIYGFNGDGLAATNTQFRCPYGIVPDNQGNWLVSDWQNHRVRRVAPNGLVSTIIGTGISGYLGNGGPAINARISLPWQVILDAQQNIIFGEITNNVIRMVPQNNGTYFGQNMTANNIYPIAGTGVFGYTGDGGPATSARLGQVWGVRLDKNGNLLIGDHDNNRIRMVPVTNGTFYGQNMVAFNIYTIAGAGVFGGSGLVSNGNFSGDNGPALNAEFNRIADIFIDAEDNIWIADEFNHRVRKMAPNGMITTIAGNGTGGFAGDGGPPLSAQLNRPGGVFVKNGVLYISDSYNHRVRKIVL